MNRPRNRQPRPLRGNDGRGRGRGGRGGQGGRGAPATPQQAAGTVPTLRQVIPGAGVFIILKENQSTGEETRGVVGQVLTAGNHPRGIKVRLRDGQVGRVQRMDKVICDDQALYEQRGEQSSGSDQRNCDGDRGVRERGKDRFSHSYTDVRNDEYLEGPPERSLADFLPADFGAPETTTALTTNTLDCPFCEDFKGDEVAVTHHIEQAHLS